MWQVNHNVSVHVILSKPNVKRNRNYILGTIMVFPTSATGILDEPINQSNATQQIGLLHNIVEQILLQRKALRASIQSWHKQ